jgi:hypothetical protein
LIFPVCTLRNKGERFAPVVAMMSTAPYFTYCSMVGKVAKNAWVRPTRKSTVAGLLPAFVCNVYASALAKTKQAESALGAGWSAFRTMLHYKCDRPDIMIR